MRISEILSVKGTGVVTILPESTVRELVAVLREHNLGAVVVSTDRTTVQGIVSERDVIRALAAGTAVLDASVASIMTADVHTCAASDPVQSLMAVMTDQRIRHLPVVDERGRLHGIVSIGDVVKSTVTELRYERDRLQEYVSG